MADERHPAWDQIEPAACVGHRVPDGIRPGEHEIELSKAISLKRIADDLAGIRLSLATIAQANQVHQQWREENWSNPNVR